MNHIKAPSTLFIGKATSRMTTHLNLFSLNLGTNLHQSTSLHHTIEFIRTCPLLMRCRRDHSQISRLISIALRSMVGLSLRLTRPAACHLRRMLSRFINKLDNLNMVTRRRSMKALMLTGIRLKASMLST